MQLVNNRNKESLLPHCLKYVRVALLSIISPFRGAVVDMVRRGDSHRERIIDRVWQVFGSMEPAGAGQEVGHVRSFSSSAKFYFSISHLIVETNYLFDSLPCRTLASKLKIRKPLILEEICGERKRSTAAE